MKVEMFLRVSIDVPDPAGYPDELPTRSSDDRKRTKRERQVLASYERAVRRGEKKILDLLKDQGLSAEKVKQHA